MANHGTVKSGKIMESFGKDDSNYCGSAQDERGNTGQKGGVTNLSHTFGGGVKANQKGS